MPTKTNSATSKIHAAEKRWHNTIGEYLLRYGGIFLSLSIIVIGIKYSYNTLYSYNDALFTSNIELDNVIKYDSERTEKTVLFVSVNSNTYYSNEANVLKEAIASYHGVKILNLQGNYDSQVLKKENQIVFVMGSPEINNLTGLLKLMKKVADNDIPMFWLGSGFSRAAHIFDIPFSQKDRLNDTLLPPKSSLTYKGTEIAADGMPYARENLKGFAELGEVIGRVKLYGKFSRAALIRHGNIIYSAFNPFSRTGQAPFALSVIMDSLSLLVGKHKANPRIVFRLEDINGVSHNQNDDSFKKTVDYLMEQEVFMHLGIIPTMVDANGNVTAQIDAALPVLEFIKKNPAHVGIVQHGYKHWRKDPRNKGMGSGDASEFFLNDDLTMGVRSAKKFAKEVIKEGCAVMLKNNLIPFMFEAPHYEISPSQQQVAEEIFSIMQHPPLFYYGEGPYGFHLPWFTRRNAAVYVAGVSSYVDLSNPDSVKDILSSLKIAASILPDPIINIFFHPYIMEVPGREGELKKLIEGIKGLNYHFINMMDELQSLPTPRCW